MKKLFVVLILLLGHNILIQSQTLSPTVIATAGGFFTGGGSSLSWTMGETFYTTLQNGNVVLTQGQQQPYVEIRILNMSLFLQGFYQGSGLMSNCLNITGHSPNPLDADSVTISVMGATAPYNLVESQIGILKTNGDVSVSYSQAVLVNTSYYLRVTHRNAVETWSKFPVLLTSSTTYSFITGASQAFGDNQALTSDNLYYAFYSGDINHDGAVDGGDFLELDPSIQNGDGGYAIGDLNGDGAVDGGDFLVLDPNIQGGVGAAIP